MATQIQRGSEIPLHLFAVIPSLPRPILARLAQRIIDHLDERDGDPEAEDNGDETDGTHAEDDFCFHGGSGPGCSISDPGGEHDNF